VLRISAAEALGVLLPSAALASARPAPPERALRFLNLHAGERAATTYFAEGRYQRDQRTVGCEAPPAGRARPAPGDGGVAGRAAVGQSYGIGSTCRSSAGST
jgi:hypothetical protein